MLTKSVRITLINVSHEETHMSPICPSRLSGLTRPSPVSQHVQIVLVGINVCWRAKIKTFLKRNFHMVNDKTM